jgi:transcriptional regulator with XRE-family HTH domain
MRKVFRLLKSRKKTQVDLARACGVTKGAVTNWKRGGNVSPDHARLIVRFFGGEVTHDDIYRTKFKKASGE